MRRTRRRRRRPLCDEEISKSKASKDEKTMESAKITSRRDTATSKKNELGNSVNELQAEIAALDKAMGQATKLRTEEKATHDKASKDSKEAAEAVESAISLLKEYYESTSLAQTGARVSRQPTFGGKKSDAGDTIISILEMAGEDFTKTYMDLNTEEAAAVQEYKKLTAESATSRAAKAAEVKGAESQRRRS